MLTSCGIPSVSDATEKYREHTDDAYVHRKNKTKKCKKERSRNRREVNRKNETKNKHLLRAQAEARGDEVGVCQYDEPYDIFICPAHRRATR